MPNSSTAPVSDFEYHLGYQHGRLKAGFFVGCLSVLPDVDDFEVAAYTTVAEHHYKQPTGLDMKKIKELAKERMFEIGNRNLVKVFPITRHNDAMDLDQQYPPGAGIPQWKLTKQLPFHIFKEIEATHTGNIHLRY